MQLEISGMQYIVASGYGTRTVHMHVCMQCVIRIHEHAPNYIFEKREFSAWGSQTSTSSKCIKRSLWLYIKASNVIE